MLYRKVSQIQAKISFIFLMFERKKDKPNPYQGNSDWETGITNLLLLLGQQWGCGAVLMM